MSTITKERVEEFISNPASLVSAEESEILELARIALASLSAKTRKVFTCSGCGAEGLDEPLESKCHCNEDGAHWAEGVVYTAPPAPVENTGLQRKAAVHDALCEKYNVESLTDFVDWQRNHIAELEAAPPAPVGEGETAVMPDYPGYALTQRECYQAGEERAAQKAWVACSERMPTPNQYVLVCNGVWVGMGMHSDSEHIEDDERWQDERHEFIDLLHHPVTHWMPLPEAPQQEA